MAKRTRMAAKVSVIVGLSLLMMISFTTASYASEIEWKTYTSHDYSIQYPTSFGVIEDDASGAFSERTWFVGIVDSKLVSVPNIALVEVRVEELSQPTRAEKYAAGVKGDLEQLGEEFEQTPFLKLSEQRVEIDEVSAIEMVYLYREPPPASVLVKVRIVLVVKDRIGYRVSCSASPTIYDQANEDYFEPMIQSFNINLPGLNPQRCLSAFSGLLSRVA